MYFHGYTQSEIRRLSEQSEILEPLLHSGTSFKPGSHVFEPGSGIGAQSAILLRRNPGIRLTCMDISDDSLNVARERLRETGKNISFCQGDIHQLPFDEEVFDHIFICFLLEHLTDPYRALRECARVLKTGGTLTVIEGDHGSAFWHPQYPESLWVWNSFIRAQQSFGFDPGIGRRLFPLLKSAGFSNVSSEPRWIYTNGSDMQKQSDVLTKIIVPMTGTARQYVITGGTHYQNMWDTGMAQLAAIADDPGGTFFYTWFKAVGVKTV